MRESQIVKAWEDRAHREGEAKGKAEALLQFLQKRFKTVPDDICARPSWPRRKTV